jgi:hypothetical protein
MRYIFNMFESESVPENLLPVPSKHKINFFRGFLKRVPFSLRSGIASVGLSWTFEALSALSAMMELLRPDWAWG